ncbi:MAG: long-chain fatty acid--CoA ligase [Planctomycetes bacterium]|nr:long-chain fatty acid--CoA ligase [Planctomycetota bacterium]
MKARTLPGVLLEQAREMPGRTAFGHFEPGKPLVTFTWAEIRDRVLSLAAALEDLGLAKGDRGSVFAYNSPCWYVTDFAIQVLGGVSVPIYMNNTGEQAAYVLADSGAKVVYVDSKERLEALLPELPRLPALVRVLVPESLAGFAAGSGRVETLAALEARGRASDAARREKIAAGVASIDPDSTVTLSYTSGTTGEPKGVRLSHANVLVTVETVSGVVGEKWTPEDRVVSYLPLAHIAQRMMDLAALYHGAQLYFPGEIKQVLDCVQAVRPTVFMGVPRVLEKVRAGIENKVALAPARRQRIFRWAVGVGLAVTDCVEAGRTPGLWLAFKNRIADRLVFRKIRAALGGEVRYILAGGAPLARDLGRFFYAVGLPTFEVFGLTETTALVTVNRPGKLRYGTVGATAGLGEIKIAEDGEILFRGPNVFAGYWNKEQATAEAIRDGWFYTGDLGEFTPDGFLKVTGRKKELLKTSGGKYVAPLPIEASLVRHPLVDQVMVVGDNWHYLTALFTMNLEEARRRHGADRTNVALADLPELRSELARHVEKVNQTLARYETVKRFDVLPDTWTPETGELTPTMKLKRRVIVEKYREKIERMYSAPAVETGQGSG